MVALTDQGRARTALRWTGPAEQEYRGPSGEVVSWPEELEPAAPLDNAQVAGILDRLTRDGVDVTVPLVSDPAVQAMSTSQAAATGARALRSIVTGAVAAVHVRPRRPGLRRRDLHDVLVLDDGLLITRVTGKRYGMLAAAQSNYLPGPLVRRGMQRVQLLAEAVAGDPQSWAADPSRGALWLPYPTIHHAALRKNRGNVVMKRLTLDLADEPASASTLTLKWTAFSVEVGEVDSVLIAALHRRF